MNLIEAIEQNEGLNFTGIINILEPNARQFLGSISMIEGKIIGARWRKLRAVEALVEIVIAEQQMDALDFVSEPEIVHNYSNAKPLSSEEFRKIAADGFQKFLQSKRLAPPQNLKLVLNSEFVVEGEDISPLEFQIMKQLSDDPEIKNIYEVLDVPKHIVDAAFIQLRKKSAVRVVK